MKNTSESLPSDVADVSVGRTSRHRFVIDPTTVDRPSILRWPSAVQIVGLKSVSAKPPNHLGAA